MFPPHQNRSAQPKVAADILLAPAEADARASTETLRSVDIGEQSQTYSSLMDPEASPWDDVPSSTPTANVNDDDTQPPQESPSTSLPSPAATTPPSKGPTSRGPRGAKKVAVPTTRLEPVEGALDPLGPLQDNSSRSELDQPPSPPLKEQSLPLRTSRQPPAASQKSNQAIESPDSYDDDRGSTSSRQRSSFQNFAQLDSTKRQTQPSMSIEQAARPTFTIAVGDPHKVGDLTSSHIVYQVQTKTTSKAYKQPEFTVSRRYKDFLWLYNTLHSNNPGVVVPPPPEKQAVGRFDSNFVESRRAALERMLNKTAAHPILHHDADLKIFLESDAFHVDVKHREHREIGLGENKGVLSSFGIGNTSTGKFIEHDDWFHDRRLYLDALESQLKALLKSIDTVVVQRKALAEAAGDFSASLQALATVELSVSLSNPLAGLSDIQLRIRELYERQAQQDVLTLGITIDEYVRLIGSVKTAFSQRQKSFHSWHNAESELQKRRALQDKVLRSGRTQQDRLNQLQADVSDGERRSHQARLLFEDMGRLMRTELERFEREKVEDFKSGVETFLEGAIEAQKELIECWETFLMQFDADEDGEPFFKPQQVSAPPADPSQQKGAPAEDRVSSPVDAGEESRAGETAQAPAAMATAEQEA